MTLNRNNRIDYTCTSSFQSLLEYPEMNSAGNFCIFIILSFHLYFINDISANLTNNVRLIDDDTIVCPKLLVPPLIDDF